MVGRQVVKNLLQLEVVALALMVGHIQVTV